VIPMTDSELVVALLKRDGKQHGFPHLNEDNDYICPYLALYTLRGRRCPWCGAQEKRGVVAQTWPTKPVLFNSEFLEVIGWDARGLPLVRRNFGNNQRHLDGSVYAPRRHADKDDVSERA